MNTNLKHALLEGARVVVLAGVSALITWVINLINMGVLNSIIPLSPEINTLIGGTLMTILKSWDRSIHEDDTNPSKGLLPF